MFSAHTLHVLHVVLRDTLIFFLVLFVALFMWLKVGIHADKLTLGKYEIDGLYIKLDKKLTLKANNIVIPKTRSKTSLQNIDSTFDTIKYLFTFFHYIELKKVDYKNNDYQIIFADNTLYVGSDEYEIAGNIERVGQRLVAEIPMLKIKKENIYIDGKLTYFLQKDRLEVDGAFDAYNIKGNFAAFKEDELVSFAVKSDTFSDLKTLIDKTGLSPVIKSWIVDKVQAKNYKLNSLVGKGNIEKDGFKMDFDALKAEVLFEDVQIYYKEKLAPVTAESFMLSYKKGGLYFDLKKPKYKDRDLNGSKVSIVDLIGEKPTTLVLDLHIKSVIDPVVHEILQAYELHIPVSQKGSMAKVDVKIDIPLVESSKETSVFVNVDLEEGDVTINNIKLPVLKGNVQYDKGVVTLKNVDIKDEWYAAIVSGKVYLQNKKADLKLNVDRLSLSAKKEKFFKLQNKKNVAVKLDYAAYTVDIPDLNVKLIKRDKEYTIKLMNLKTIKPYLQNMEIEVDGGHLDIMTKDFKTYTYEGVLKRNICFFYDNNNVCHTQVPAKGKVSKNTFTLQAFQNRLYVDTYKGLIKVNRLNIDLKEFVDSRDKHEKSASKSKKLTIRGTKSQLRYDKYRLVTDSYTINVSANGNIKAIGKLKGDQVLLTQKGKNIRVEALRIKDQLLHPLINFKGLHKGRYTFRASGDPDKLMHGEIIIEGGVMRDFKAYNNTLAFINTIPALATLSKPGYSNKGFTIKKGIAKFRKIGERIIFDMIRIEGISANIVGKGEIDLKKNTINMNMAIQTARELGKVVGSIPLLGYIIMGEDKSMTVGLKITGSLSQPKVQTSASKELLKLPLDILKRTLQSPAHMINKTPKPEKKPFIEIEKPEIFNRIAP